MFEYLCSRQDHQKPIYLERVEDLENLQIVRLIGAIDQSVIPVIEERIEQNRKHGGKIDKNILLDFKKVEHVDSATIAFHILQIKEFQQSHHQLAFINVSEQLHGLIEVFKLQGTIKIYDSEQRAIAELNNPFELQPKS
jgi:anti-anti-sigma factor